MRDISNKYKIYTISTNKKPTNFIIYKATSPSGKGYVGLTTKKLEERIANHNYHGSNTKGSHRPFYKAINKYGYDKLKWEIIDYANDYEELKELEIYWIDKLKTYAEYNVSLGGEGGYGVVHSKERRKLSSFARGGSPFLVYTKEGEYIGEWDTPIECVKSLKLKGKQTTVSRQIRTCLNDNQRQKTYKGYMFIKKEDICLLNEKIEMANTVETDNFYVYDMTTEEVVGFFNYKDCREQCHISNVTLNNCVNNDLNNKHYIYSFKNNLKMFKEIERRVIDNVLIFNAYDLSENKFIGTFTSTIECSEILQCHPSLISGVLKKERYGIIKKKYFIIHKSLLIEGKFVNIYKKARQNFKPNVFNVYKDGDGIFIGQWDNIRLCCDELNLTYIGVNHCLHKYQKTHKSYEFYYLKDDPYINYKNINIA